MRPSILLVIAAFVLPNLVLAAPCPIPDQNAGVRESRLWTWDTGFSGDEENTGAYMGVDIADVTAERLSALKLKDERGVEVTMVDQDAPAGKAGLKEHDVILTMNDTKVESGAQLRRMIRETPAGRVVTLGISRDGQPLTLKVQLADRRNSPAWTAKHKDYKFEMPAMPNLPDFDVPVSVVVVHSSMRSGLMVENITPQLGEFFGAKDGRGVLVRSVEKGSRAERAGFRAGDVIVRVNDQAVHDTSDFSHAIRSATSSSVTVGIIREKREQNLTLPLPERKDSGGLFEESFDLPDFDAEADVDLAQVQNQLAELKPQLQFAVEQSRRAMEQVTPEIEKAVQAAKEEVERQRPEIERAMREAQSAMSRASEEFCKDQKEWREQTRKLQKELQKQRREMMRENRKQFERLQHELHGDWMQI
ncbi:MAG TPA: PDZ domain-containing protein [Terriglobales bacterium]|nr:PDZ domain-containing protein [Terriglobales bacterium]